MTEHQKIAVKVKTEIIEEENSDMELCTYRFDNCSLCNQSLDVDYNFCPKCGVLLDWSKND